MALRIQMELLPANIRIHLKECYADVTECLLCRLVQRYTEIIAGIAI
jgi:hypothetical protein